MCVAIGHDVELHANFTQRVGARDQALEDGFAMMLSQMFCLLI